MNSNLVSFLSATAIASNSKPRPPAKFHPKLLSMDSKAVSTTAITAQPRPLATFHPDVWDDHFTSSSLSNTELESHDREVEELKGMVKTLLLASTNDLIQNITLIDSLCRLGVSYHFKEIIEEQLQRIFVDVKRKIVSCNHEIDLYTSALLFRVLRQHGYKISCEILDKFRENDGKFKDTVSSDVRGMLSLYEAIHVRLHGEDILEEALVFTQTHLEALVRDHPSHPLARQILQALEQPLHKGMPRLEARRYISLYQEDDCQNETLLEFAVLDFNRVQLLHQQELGLIRRWYEESGYEANLNYIRNRVVEVYFWILGMYFEPHYSRARIISTKISTTISIIDDTYDSYGTFEELECFTNAIQRWDASALDQLPDYMKYLYKTVLDLYRELEIEMTLEGRAYSVDYAINALKQLVNHYHTEAKWANEGYAPSFDEYMETALSSSACHTSSVYLLVGMKGIATKDVFEWMYSKPKCVKAWETIGRLLNDMKSHKVERAGKPAVSAVESYMNEYGVCEEEAVEEMERMIEDAWKDLNDECMKPTAVSMDVLMRVINLARTTEVVYKFDDGYTNSGKHVKTYITSLFVDPIVQNKLSLLLRA